MQTLSKKVVVFFVLFYLLSSFNFTYSQKKEETTDENFYWCTLGIGTGAGLESSSLPVAFNLNLTYRHIRNMFSFRIATTSKILGSDLNDYGLLYGYTITTSAFFSSLGAGVAIVSGTLRGGLFSNDKNKSIGPTIGLPLEAQLFWHPSSAFGLGLYFFADINPEKTFDGVTLSIQFGKLR